MSFSPSNANWFCVRTKAGYEFRAVVAFSYLSAEIQEAVGKVDVYFPRIRASILAGSQRRAVLAPLFPGYFFARFDLARAGRFVASRPGVVDLVRFGTQAAEIPAQTIEDLKSADFENADQVTKPFQFQPGQRLLVREGPFAGMEAEYVGGLNGGQRALLLLEYLQSRVSLIANASLLEIAC